MEVTSSPFTPYLPLLAHNALFNGIADRELPEVLSQIGAKIRRYDKDAYILLSDSSSRLMGIVLSGEIQVLKEDAFGNRAIIAQFGPGHLFGEAFAFAQTERLPVSVLAVSECHVLLLDYHHLIAPCPGCCNQHSLLVSNMLRILAHKNILLNAKIEVLSRRTTREKLLTYLHGQSLMHGSLSFDIPFNRQQLADYLCVDRSALSSELGKLRNESVLQFRRQHFELTHTGDQ